MLTRSQPVQSTPTLACRIQADAIIVSSEQVFAPGQLVISHGRIVEVTPHTRETPDVRLDDCVLLPGLVNPHTHLEFSDLREPLPAGSHFPEWISNVLRHRQQSGSTESSQATAISTGLAQSLATGVAALGDIVSTPWLPSIIQHSANRQVFEAVNGLTSTDFERMQPHLTNPDRLPGIVAFIEQLGLSADRRAALAIWRNEVLFTPRDAWPVRLLELAFSPHAPYSTPPELWSALAGLAASQNRPLAMHVLESAAERQWLDSGSGPMADMLAKFGAAGWRLPPGFIEQLTQGLSQVQSALLIHGNYLNDVELDQVARCKNLNIVYCPRTHAHFGHEPYPLAAVMKRGIRWLLGTDSRSTNPDLNLWQEARTALALHSSVRPTQAFSAITDSAASALGIQGDFGSLKPGHCAALNVIRVSRQLPSEAEEIFELLFESFLHPQLIV